MLHSTYKMLTFQARDIETGALMAVKQISLSHHYHLGGGVASTGDDDNDDDLDRSRKAQERLIREEVRMLAGLSHPNVVRFFGAVKVPKSGQKRELLELVVHELVQLVYLSRKTPR